MQEIASCLSRHPDRLPLQSGIDERPQRSPPDFVTKGPPESKYGNWQTTFLPVPQAEFLISQLENGVQGPPRPLPPDLTASLN